MRMRTRRTVCVLAALSLALVVLVTVMLDLDTLRYYRDIWWDPEPPLPATEHIKVCQKVVGEPQFVIVICHGEHHNDQDVKNFQRQLRQISVLLKSAAALTAHPTLRFNIMSDSPATHEAVTNITRAWPHPFQQRIQFSEYREVYYPPGTEDIRYMFRPCTTARLFLAQAYEDKDAAVFLDTDTLFLRPPEDLWCQVAEFSEKQVIGIAPCLYMYGPGYKFPTYGTSGLNAGVLLMNYTRIRALDGGWTQNILSIVNQYKPKLTLADQDILNILFSSEARAAQLYEMGCEWNYREKLCSLGTSRCKAAERVGVGLLHGAAYTFVNNKEPKLQAVFEAWEQQKVGDSLQQFASRLEATLNRQKKGYCAHIERINDILLHGLKDTLRRRQV